MTEAKNGILLLLALTAALSGSLLDGCENVSKSGTLPPGTTADNPAVEACKKAGGTLGQAVACLEASGVLPVLDRSDSVAGPDVDGNGIRDDIDAYIAKQGYSVDQAAAVQQLARATQAAVVLGSLPPLSPNAVSHVATRVMRAVHCVYVQFPAANGPSPDTTNDNIEKYTSNTRNRTRAYLKFNDAMNGAVLQAPEGNSCESQD